MSERLSRANRTRLGLLLIATVAALLLVTMGPRVRSIVGNSLQLAGGVTAIALPVGTLLAVLLTKTTARFRQFWLLGFLPLLFLPLYLQVAGWQAAFGVGGWLNPPPPGDPAATWLTGWWGATVIHAAAAVPMVLLIVSLGLRQIDASAEEAASLNAPPWRVLSSVTLPQAWPALVVATVWIVVICATEISVTDFFGIRTFGEEIYTASAMGAFPMDGASVEAPLAPLVRYGGLLSGSLLLACVVGAGMLAGVRIAADRYITGRRQLWRVQLSGRTDAIAQCILAFVWLIVVGVPLLSLIVEAGRTARFVDGDPAVLWELARLLQNIQAACSTHRFQIGSSIVLAAVVAITCTFFGLLAAWTARWFTRARWPIGAAVALLLAVPGPLVGVAILRFFTPASDSPLAPLAALYDDTWIAVWLAQCLRLLPLATLAFMVVLSRVPAIHLEAARMTGGGWAGTLWGVVLPGQLIACGCVAIAVALLSLGELSATVLVTPAGVPPVTVRLFALLHYGVEGRVAAMALVLLAAIWIGSATVQLLAQRGVSRLSRSSAPAD